MICTTLNRIREHDPCVEGWKKLLQHLGKTKADDEPLPFSVIVESNGIKDALWACRTVPEHDREWRLFAVWCARQVQHLITDQRSHDAINVAERFALGAATKNELDAAFDAAWSAARDAAFDAARGATWSAAWSAARDAAQDAAKDAAWFAAWSAAQDAAQDAAWFAAFDAARDAAFEAAFDAAQDAASYAAFEAARGAAWPAQTAEFLRVVTETECCEAIRARGAA